MNDLFPDIFSPLNGSSSVSQGYRGEWDASTNTPTLPSTPTAPDYKEGDHWNVTAGGTQFGIVFTDHDEAWVVSDGAGGQEWAKKSRGDVDAVNNIGPDAAGNVEIDASDIPNSPAGNISATNVQAAIDELDVEKVDTTVFDNALKLANRIKYSAALATTANIVLSGEQNIDGTLTSASQVLVKDQSVASENGIYVTNAGNWLRRDDFVNISELPATVFNGDLIQVTGGDDNGGKTFRVTSSGSLGDGGHDVGSDDIDFALAFVDGATNISENDAVIDGIGVRPNHFATFYDANAAGKKTILVIAAITETQNSTITNEIDIVMGPEASINFDQYQWDWQGAARPPAIHGGDLWENYITYDPPSSNHSPITRTTNSSRPMHLTNVVIRNINTGGYSNTPFIKESTVTSYYNNVDITAGGADKSGIIVEGISGRCNGLVVRSNTLSGYSGEDALVVKDRSQVSSLTFSGGALAGVRTVDMEYGARITQATFTDQFFNEVRCAGFLDNANGIDDGVNPNSLTVEIYGAEKPTVSKVIVDKLNVHANVINGRIYNSSSENAKTGSGTITQAVGNNANIGNTTADETSGTHNTNWSGPWAVAQVGNIKYSKVGKIVFLKIPNVQATHSSDNYITIDTVLPAALRPTSQVQTYSIISYEFTFQGTGYAIVETNGTVKIGPYMDLPGTPGNYTDAGNNVGIVESFISYTIS